MTEAKSMQKCSGVEYRKSKRKWFVVCCDATSVSKQKSPGKKTVGSFLLNYVKWFRASLNRRERIVVAGEEDEDKGSRI